MSVFQNLFSKLGSIRRHSAPISTPSPWPKTNRESWAKIHHFIDEYPDDEIWTPWKADVKTVIAALERRGLADHFRIGQSMHHIILSTMDRHRLSTEPRVTLDFIPKQRRVVVAYSKTNLWLNAPLTGEHIEVQAAMPVIVRQLRRLWHDTKSNDPMPAGLNETYDSSQQRST